MPLVEYITLKRGVQGDKLCVCKRDVQALCVSALCMLHAWSGRSRWLLVVPHLLGRLGELYKTWRVQAFFYY